MRALLLGSLELGQVESIRDALFTLRKGVGGADLLLQIFSLPISSQGHLGSFTHRGQAGRTSQNKDLCKATGLAPARRRIFVKIASIV